VHASIQEPLKKTVCLNMIVKNEAHVIRRSLESCKPLIDYWVIVDTGSTDGTQDIIREHMKDIPGELCEIPWKSSEYNRNEALKIAEDKADYILVIDADDIFKYEPGFKWPNLDKDAYYFETLSDTLFYKRINLFRSKVGVKWVGVLHEYVHVPLNLKKDNMSGISYTYLREGARSKDPKTYEKDAAILEADLLENPNNHRTAFYLAQSYRDAKNHPKALEAYQRRVDLGGWDEEVFCSLMQIANLQKTMNEAPKKIEESYWRAFQFRPTRAEPLYHLSQHYRDKHNYQASYSISKLGMAIALPQDILFVEKYIYDWGLLFENSISAWWIGKYQESANLSNHLLTLDLPSHIQEIVKKNLNFAQDKLAQGSA